MARGRRIRNSDLLTLPYRALSLAGVAVGLVGCGLLPVPKSTAFAESVSTHFEGTTLVFEVAPWPFDESVAWLCQRQPNGDVRVDPLPADRGCIPLDVEAQDDALVATAEMSSMPGAVSRQFEASGPPWFLAVAGERDGISGSTVIEIAESPIPSDPGPT